MYFYNPSNIHRKLYFETPTHICINYPMIHYPHSKLTQSDCMFIYVVNTSHVHSKLFALYSCSKAKTQDIIHNIVIKNGIFKILNHNFYTRLRTTSGILWSNMLFVFFLSKSHCRAVCSFGLKFRSCCFTAVCFGASMQLFLVYFS